MGNIISTDYEQLTTILDCVAEGVFTVDLERKIQFFNGAAEEITGFSSNQAIGRYCYDVLRTPLCAKKCTLQEVEKTGKNITIAPSVYSQGMVDLRS